MRKILHIVGVRWWSALAAYAVALATGQARRGDDVSVAALRGSPAEAEAERRGLRAKHGFGPGLRNLIGLAMRLREELRSDPPDVLHIHTGMGHASAEWACRSTAERPLLVRTRAEIRPPQATPWNKWLFRRADALMLSGNVLTSDMSDFGVSPGRIWILPGGADTAHLAPDTLGERDHALNRLGLPVGVFCVGVVGRLSPVKGHRYAVEALAMLKAMDRPIHLVIAGDSAQLTRDDLERVAHDGGVGDRVHFVGRLTDVRDIYSAIDIGLVSSIGSEAVCRVAVEMMACGLPVIASRVGVLPETVLDGDTGILVEPRDPAAIAEAITRLAGNADLRARMGRRAREHAVSEYDLAVVAERCETIYASALTARSGT